MRKDIIQALNSLGLKIPIKTNFTVVNSLNATLDLDSGTYRPYRKPNDRLSYVNTAPCRPSIVLKNLIKCKRFSNLSDKDIFEAPAYNEAPAISGFKAISDKRSASDQWSANDQRVQRPYSIVYTPGSSNRKQKLHRKTLWFAPHNSLNVWTCVIKKFLRLVDNHSTRPLKHRKVFNRHNLRLSFSCASTVKKKVT